MNTKLLSKVSLKQTLIGCGFTLLTGSALALPVGSVTHGGVVPAFLDVVLTNDAGINALDLTINEPNRLITSVNERTNNILGYTVRMDSANGTTSGEFLGVANGDTLPYTITYGGVAQTLVAGSAIVTDVNSRTGFMGVDNDVRISYDGTATFLSADTYSDTLTFTIIAK